MSPELMKGNCFGKDGAKKNDIFGLGMHYLESSGLSLDDIYDNLPKPKPTFDDFMENFSYETIQPAFDRLVNNNPERKEILEFAYKMVNPDPGMRPDINKVVEELEKLDVA